MMKRLSYPRGFTMVEMMVVVALIAVLLSLVAPSFQEQLARRSLEGTATELSTDIQFARSQAVSNNAPVSLTATVDGYVVADGATTYKTVTLSPGIVLAASAPVTYDQMRGMATPTTFTLRSTRTAATMLVRTNAMGRVTLCSPGGSLKGYAECS